MEFLQSLVDAFSWQILISVVLIDLVLSGDNAVVIALAARNVPKEMQKKAIMIGTAGAIVLRLLFAALVVWLLKIPFLSLIGGIMLIWIAYKLIVGDEEHGDTAGGVTVWSAVKTIIIADAVMSLDNVIALAGVSDGHFGMILVGILISIPVIVWGSQLIIKLMDKFPIIMYIGSGILLWSAGEMITKEKELASFFETYSFLHFGLPVALIVSVLSIGFLVNKKKQIQA